MTNASGEGDERVRELLAATHATVEGKGILRLRECFASRSIHFAQDDREIFKIGFLFAVRDYFPGGRSRPGSWPPHLARKISATHNRRPALCPPYIRS